MLVLGGCAEPLRVVGVPTSPAAAPRGAKETGEVGYLAIRGDEVRGAGFVHAGTLAQSGEGPLGDWLFRESPEGFVEACRYRARGRVCQLVPLSDGSYLGGGVSWIVPKAARSTPRASGWVAAGLEVKAAAGLSREAAIVNSLSTIFLGRAYHCRFGDDLPVCLDVPATREGIGYAVLGVLSLQEGPTRKEVAWLGLFGEMTRGARSPELGIREIQRCETTEEASQVTCKLVTMKGSP